MTTRAPVTCSAIRLSNHSAVTRRGLYLTPSRCSAPRRARTRNPARRVDEPAAGIYLRFSNAKIFRPLRHGPAKHRQRASWRDRGYYIFGPAACTFVIFQGHGAGMGDCVASLARVYVVHFSFFSFVFQAQCSVQLMRVPAAKCALCYLFRAVILCSSNATETLGVTNKETPRTRTHRLEHNFVDFQSNSKQEQRCVSFGPYRPLRW